MQYLLHAPDEVVPDSGVALPAGQPEGLVAAPDEDPAGGQHGEGTLRLVRRALDVVHAQDYLCKQDGEGDVLKKKTCLHTEVLNLWVVTPKVGFQTSCQNGHWKNRGGNPYYARVKYCGLGGMLLKWVAKIEHRWLTKCKGFESFWSGHFKGAVYLRVICCAIPYELLGELVYILSSSCFIKNFFCVLCVQYTNKASNQRGGVVEGGH